jgi:hypothetical protein
MPDLSGQVINSRAVVFTAVVIKFGSKNVIFRG